MSINNHAINNLDYRMSPCLEKSAALLVAMVTVVMVAVVMVTVVMMAGLSLSPHALSLCWSFCLFVCVWEVARFVLA